MRRYPPEVVRFVTDHVKGTHFDTLARLTNDAFGTSFSEKSMKSFCGNRKLRNELPRRAQTPKRLFPPDEDAFIRSHVKGTNPPAMAALLLNEFGHKVTPEQVKAFYSRNHLKTGIDGRFKKGRQSVNKGKKMSEFLSPEAIEKLKKTQFKKGFTPHNKKAVGSERIDVDGYVFVKVGDFEDTTKNYRPKHKVVWEAHYGPIPPGMVIRFLDGDKTNCAIENLQLITYAEHMEMNRRNFRFKDPELMKAAIGTAKLNCAIFDRKRKKQKESEPC